MHVLEQFQESFLSEIGKSLANNQSVIAQLEGGGGKTTVFANISYRYINKSNKDVIIFVNSEKLLDQARETIKEWFDYIAQKIDAKTKTIPPNCRIFIAMVETFNNRVIDVNFRKYFENVGLCIIDEAHIGNFKKVLPFFITAKRIGFTATPISAVKKEPLNLYYENIVVGLPTKDLIELNANNPHRGLVPAREYAFDNVDVTKIKKKGNEFDKDSMVEAFSGKRQIENTVNAYITKTYGQKAICFNADIQHSLDVTEAMLKAGLNARHLDGNKNGRYGNENYRLDCFKWLKYTPNAILCNVGVATTGFDEKTIQTVINNSSMLSTTLFRQKRLRGSRAYVSPEGVIKTHFTHLDLGDNIIGCGHGEFEDHIDWKFIFENPKISKPSIAPVKSCPLCGSINTAAARYCKGKTWNWLEGESDCEHVFEFSEESKREDTQEKKLRLLGSGIDINKNIEYFKDKIEYNGYLIIYKQIADLYKKNHTEMFLEIEDIKECFFLAIQKCTEWFKLLGKKRFFPFKVPVKLKMLQHLREVGFEISIEEEEILFNTDNKDNHD